MSTPNKFAAIQNLVNKAQNGKGQTLQDINLNEIQVVDQVRKDFSDIEELAENMKSVGQQQPIVVSPKGPNGMYRLQKGERRYRAAQLAGFTSIEAVVRAPNSDEGKEIIAQLSENIQRANLKPLEIARSIKGLIENQSMSQADIARLLGKSKAYVSGHAKLNSAPERIQKMLEDGACEDQSTANYLIAIHNIDSERANALIDIAYDRGVSRKQVQQTLNQLQGTQGKQHSNPVTSNATSEQRNVVMAGEGSNTVPEEPSIQGTASVKQSETEKPSRKSSSSKSPEFQPNVEIRVLVSVAGQEQEGSLLLNTTKESGYVSVVVNGEALKFETDKVRLHPEAIRRI
jgi:ParB family transcriptional regulator, chromosome partitioning protein